MLLNCYDDRVAFFYVVELLYNINPFPSLCCVRYRRDNDAGWAKFKTLLAAKCDKYGRDLIIVDRWYPSSQICSKCGQSGGKKELDVRQWTCLFPW